MIKLIKNKFFNNSCKVKESKKKIDDNQYYNSEINILQEYKDENIDVNTQEKVENVIEKLERLSAILENTRTVKDKQAKIPRYIKGHEIVTIDPYKTIEYNVRKTLYCVDDNRLDEYTKDYIKQSYVYAGLSKTDAKLLFELQEKNKGKLELQTVLENNIPSAYIKNLWFNEIVNENLFSLKLEYQTFMTIRHNLVCKFKLADTQVMIDKILIETENISEENIRELDLYYENEIVEMVKCASNIKADIYEKIRLELGMLREAQKQKIYTLESMGTQLGITRERVRQIENKIKIKLQYLTKLHTKHLNPDFLLGLNSLSLSVLESKSYNAIEYFIEGIVKPTQYFIEEYNLTEIYYIYNNKMVQKQNKALFDEFVCTLDDDYYTSQEILNMFIKTLDIHGILDEVMVNDEVDLREVEGRLNRMSNILKTVGNKYRKHNIKQTETLELISRINSTELPPVFSTNLLLENSELEGIDIRDEHELHNHLKNNKKYFDMEIKFGRTPHIMLGDFDIIEELYKLLDEDLFLKYEEEALKKLSGLTGIKLQTIQGSYKNKFNELIGNEQMVPIDIEEFKSILSSLPYDVIHLEVFQEKYNFTLSENLKEYMRRNNILEYRLRRNWLMHTEYKSVSEYIIKNTDNYNVFNENKFGATKYNHNYNVLKKNFYKKNIYQLNKEELFIITDSKIINSISNIKLDLCSAFQFPISIKKLINSQIFEDLINSNELNHFGFEYPFWENVISSTSKLKITSEIVVEKSKNIDYLRYINGDTISKYDYVYTFESKVGCAPPYNYLEKLKENGAFIKDDMIYQEKEAYLRKLRSVI